MSRSPRHRGYSHSRSRSRSPGGYGAYEEGNCTVFAGNLNHETTDQGLREYFSAWGTVVDTKIIYDQETGRSRGFGFVKYEDQRDADDAIAEADGKILDGRPLKCNIARTGGGRGGFYPRGGFRGGYRGGPPMRGRGGGRFGDYNNYGNHYYGGRGNFGGPPRRRRSRSASPGRYSPGRYSPGSQSRSPTPTPKRHRQRSPFRDRHPAHDADPNLVRSAPPTAAGHPVQSSGPGSAPVRRMPAPRRPGSPSGSSSYTSSSSYSTTDSEATPRGGPPKVKGPPPVTAPPAPGSFRRELHEAKQRENEQSMRAAALEAEIEQARSGKDELQTKLDEATHKLQRSEESCKQYRKWLAALADYSRAVITGKEAVRAAEAEFVQREEELGLFLKEADKFLATQKHRSGRRRRGDRQTAEAEGNGQPGGILEGAVKPEHASVDSLQIDSLPADQENGADAAAKFKPGIKFKLTAA